MIETKELLFVPGKGDQVLDFTLDAFSFFELSWEGRETLEVVIGECLKKGVIDRAPGGFRYVRCLTLPQGTPGTWQRLGIPKHQSPYVDGYPSLHAPEEAGGEVAPVRYVEINGAAGPVRVRRHAVFPSWNETASHFESDNAALNRVWAFCKYSMKATAAFGLFIDGERERVPYEGDAYINQLGYFCCDADYSIARNTISYFRENPTWPVEWTLLTPLLARDYLYYSGDRESVDNWLEWLDSCLLSKEEDADGFVGRLNNGEIVDWPPAERDGYELGYRNAVPNCYRYGTFMALYELSGKESYLERAQLLRRNLRRKFLRDGFWRDSLESDHYSLHGAVFARRFGVTEPEEDKALNDYILSRGMACSVYGSQFLLEALGMLRNAHAMLDYMTAGHDRSWIGMLAAGATMSMEAWNNEAKPNQDWNHAWGAAPANIIPRWIAGVRPCEAGFARFVFDPQPGYLEKFICRHPTLHGPVEIEWDNGRGVITVPEGTAAVFKGKNLPSGRHDWQL
ncbi:MAG: hypothetical protein IKC65_01220 [Lentisphaeria bacterium]|nr:hypothetical protein [Lentisphaeria bacterium]